MEDMASSMENEDGTIDAMEIAVRADGSFLISGEDKEIKDLTASLLEQIVSLSLQDKVSYKIEGDTPISSFLIH